jgi:pyruvate-formate lyase-activating enzyme
MLETQKRRDRSPYSFANINLLGPCNVDCYFCLGKDLAEQFAKHNQIGTHFSEWANFDKLIEACQKNGIKKIYLTGQNVDALQYKYLHDLIVYLREQEFTTIGCRTNGMLAWSHMPIIRQFDTVSYSVHTLRQHTQNIIFGCEYDVPDWKQFFECSAPARVRASIVLNRYNQDEIYDLLTYLADTNVDYIQIRKVCTDTRQKELAPDMAAFEEWFCEFYAMMGEPVCRFEDAPQYLWAGKKVSVWRTVGTSVNSLNYFTDGTLSGEYFIIEGYSKLNHIELANGQQHSSENQ